MGNLNLTQVSAGQNTKEATINDADAAIEAALTESFSVVLTSGNVALTAAQYRGALAFITTGNAISRDLTLQAIKRTVWIKNGGSATMNIKLGSTTLTLGAGRYSFYYTDGTANGLEKVDVAAGLAFAFTALTDVPANYTSAGRKVVRVNAAANGLEFVDMSYTLAFYQEAIMTNGQMVYKFVATVGVTLPAGLAGSYADAEAASTGTVHFDIKKNGSDLGDITFTAAASGTFTLASDLVLVAGDKLTIIAPATADATLAGVAVSLKGYLT